MQTNATKWRPIHVSKLQLLDQTINRLIQSYDEMDDDAIEYFEDIPLSEKTLQGLTEAGFTKLSLIQKKAIPLALRGQDVLGAAKTGSGKTLAFVVPLLELLFRLKWSNLEGLACLILSPTRELAYQTFNVIKQVGQFHDFSCGLVIGGKSLKEEMNAIARTNIVICTPGRLLQHMDETWNFHADTLKMLILDEADRILDLGFAATMKAILNNLPKDRQTMLFSATQTKSVSSLISLSLQDPIFVSAHEDAPVVTPDQLEQFYVVCDEMEKVNFIWSFVKNYKQKILVFLQCCKQVKFFGALFKKLRPGIPVMSIYGRMGQLKRMTVFDNFCGKGHGILFATDLASRGLDIPSVDWVVQLDCCPDVETYIHRVGRTARFEQNGKSILVLRPQEIKIVKELRNRKIPISKIEINDEMRLDVNQRVQIEVASNAELLEDAKRALVVYVKSLKKLNRKDIFDVEQINIEKLARSYGIPKPPRVRFLRKDMSQTSQAKNDLKDSTNTACQRNVESHNDGLGECLGPPTKHFKKSDEITEESCSESGSEVQQSEEDEEKRSTHLSNFVDNIDEPDFGVYSAALIDIRNFGKQQHKRFKNRIKQKAKMDKLKIREERKAQHYSNQVRLACSEDED